MILHSPFPHEVFPFIPWQDLLKISCFFFFSPFFSYSLILTAVSPPSFPSSESPLPLPPGTSTKHSVTSYNKIRHITSHQSWMRQPSILDFFFSLYEILQGVVLFSLPEHRHGTGTHSVFHTHFLSPCHRALRCSTAVLCRSQLLYCLRPHCTRLTGVLRFFLL